MLDAYEHTDALAPVCGAINPDEMRSQLLRDFVGAVTSVKGILAIGAVGGALSWFTGTLGPAVVSGVFVLAASGMKNYRRDDLYMLTEIDNAPPVEDNSPQP